MKLYLKNGFLSLDSATSMFAIFL